jgi:metallophosphoesterase superfamily enzyme
MREIRPRLYGESWLELIDLVREIGPDQAIFTLKKDNVNIQFDSNNNTIESDGSSIRTLEELLSAAEVDLDEWYVDHYIVNKWPTTAKNKNGDLIQKANWQVKAWLKRRGFKKPDDSWTQKWISEISKRITPQPRKITEATGQTTLVVIADTHIGAYQDGKLFAEYNVEVCKQKLDTAAQEINAQCSGPVIVLHMGDIIESFTGKNKADTWKQIEMHGAQVALTAFDVLSEFFEKIDNFSECYFLGGNHDRITDDKNSDSDGQVAKIIQGMFERVGRFKTNFESTLQVLEFDDVCYILTHGDKKISTVVPERLIVDYGDSRKFNVIISAHNHNRSDIHADTEKYCSIKAPSIVPSNKFAVEMGLRNSTGFLILREKRKRVQQIYIPL